VVEIEAVVVTHATVQEVHAVEVLDEVYRRNKPMHSALFVTSS